MTVYGGFGSCLRFARDDNETGVIQSAAEDLKNITDQHGIPRPSAMSPAFAASSRRYSAAISASTSAGVVAQLVAMRMTTRPSGAFSQKLISTFCDSAAA